MFVVFFQSCRLPHKNSEAYLWQINGCKSLSVINTTHMQTVVYWYFFKVKLISRLTRNYVINRGRTIFSGALKQNKKLLKICVYSAQFPSSKLFESLNQLNQLLQNDSLVLTARIATRWRPLLVRTVPMQRKLAYWIQMQWTNHLIPLNVKCVYNMS